LLKLEQPDRFPFTHGDLIEHNRKAINRLNLLELQNIIRQKENQKLKARKLVTYRHLLTQR